MRTLLLFPGFIITVFILGALISYPLYAILSLFFEARFYKVVNYSTVLSGLVFSIVYMRLAGLTAINAIGSNIKPVAPEFNKGFAGGIIILTITAVTFFLFGINQVSPKAYQGVAPFLITVIKALLTGVVVSLIEETIFRGALFSALRKQSGYLTALLITSVFYAAVHYIKFPTPPAGEEIGWLTGLWVLGHAFPRFADPVTFNAFLSLFALGLLLGLVRWKTGNTIQCIGLHAGIVMIHKINSYLTDYNPANSYDFLFNAYEKNLGHLTTAWLSLAILLYYLFIFRTREKP